MPSKTNYPQPQTNTFTIPNFTFKNNATLPHLHLHYLTLGTLRQNPPTKTTNAILLLHGTTGSSEGFFQPSFANQLFGPSQPLSAEKYFIIIPDAIGHGHSSKPSDGLHNNFPRYCYTDMVRAQHILLTEHLGINHLRLILGTSMGAMHTWLWGITYPTFADALMPLASLPVQIAGRNRMWRKHAIDSIRQDPEFQDGEYGATPPRGFRAALHVMAWMTSAPLQWQKLAPTQAEADAFIHDLIEKRFKSDDANDFAFAFDASWDYDPEPYLHLIRASVTAVNSADDQVNPPELGILEREIAKVPDGRALVVPISDKTRGHGTMFVAECWRRELVELLERSERRGRAML